jgi:ketosteroid isomerase-like protein
MPALVMTLFAAASPAWANEAEVRAAQEARFAATLKGDLAALQTLIGDDLIYTHSSAKVETKQEFLDLLKSGFYQYKAITPSDLRVRVYGDTALVNGVAEIDVVNDGTPRHIKLRFLEAWVKRGGRWQLTTWQSTRFP